MSRRLLHRGYQCICLLLIFSLIFSNLLWLSPQKASAQFVPVYDPPLNIISTQNAKSNLMAQLKEYVGDMVAYTIPKMILRKMTSDIVQWINSGFEGSPAFIQNPGDYFADLGDQILGTFIDGTALGFLCDPFRLNIQFAFQYQYSVYQYNGCRLTGIVKNVEDFTRGNFLEGGWDGWFSMTTGATNNPYGSYLAADQAFNMQLAGRRNLASMQLGWNKGFLSWEQCQEEGRPAPTLDWNGNNPTGNVGGDAGTLVDNIQGSQTEVYGPPPPPPPTKHCKTVTPGSVIETQLNNQLSSGTRQLEIADELNEIVNALVAQLLTQVITGAQGLAGASKQRRTSGNASASLTEQLRAADPTTGFNQEEMDRLIAGNIQQAEIDGLVNQVDTARPITDDQTIAAANLALNKTASQSGVTGAAAASRANDGNLNSVHSENNGSVSRTNSTLEPYWEIDLGSEQQVGSIYVHPRTDEGDLLRDYYVFTSPRAFGTADLQTTIEQSRTSGTFLSGQIQRAREVDMQGAIGRYVRFQTSQVNGFQFNPARLQIFSHDQPQLDLAVGKTFEYSQSTGSPWVEVDLGALYQVGKIILTPEVNRIGANTRDVYIFVASQDLLVDNLQTNIDYTRMSRTYISGVSPNPAVIDLGTTRARFVRVQRSNRDIPLRLELAEVRIFPPNTNVQSATGQ